MCYKGISDLKGNVSLWDLSWFCPGSTAKANSAFVLFLSLCLVVRENECPHACMNMNNLAILTLFSVVLFHCLSSFSLAHFLLFHSYLNSYCCFLLHSSLFLCLSVFVLFFCLFSRGGILLKTKLFEIWSDFVIIKQAWTS